MFIISDHLVFRILEILVDDDGSQDVKRMQDDYIHHQEIIALRKACTRVRNAFYYTLCMHEYVRIHSVMQCV